MRVALYNLTSTTQYGGVESFVWQLAGGLARRGIGTTIVGGEGTIRAPVEGVRVVTFPFTSRSVLREIPGLSKQYTATKLVERLTMGKNARAFMEAELFDVI